MFIPKGITPRGLGMQVAETIGLNQQSEQYWKLVDTIEPLFGRNPVVDSMQQVLDEKNTKIIQLEKELRAIKQANTELQQQITHLTS